MTTTINASTSAGLVQTADTSGNLSLQSGGTTILALTSAGAAVTGTLSAALNGTVGATTPATGTFTNVVASGTILGNATAGGNVISHSSGYGLQITAASAVNQLRLTRTGSATADFRNYVSGDGWYVADLSGTGGSMSLSAAGDIACSGIIGNTNSTFRATGTSGIAYFGYITTQATLQVAFNSVSAGVSLSSAATSWGTFSDERMKDIFEPITGAAKKVASMRHAIGKYKTDEIGVRRVFFIAQDAQKVLPESVYADPDTGMLSLRYTDLMPLHGAAIAELEARLAALEAK